MNQVLKDTWIWELKNDFPEHAQTIEQLDDAALVRGNAGEIGTVEDGVLQGFGFQQHQRFPVSRLITP